MAKKKITQDRRNYRIHTDRNKTLIKKSLEDCGTGRSILIDKNDEIIAGNGVFEQAEELGIPVKVIETDGKELIAVKRVDLDTEDEKRKQMAIMDNSTTDSSMFDEDLLRADFDIPTINEWGVYMEELSDIDIDDFFEETNNENSSKPKTKKVTCPECGHEFEIEL